MTIEELVRRLDEINNSGCHDPEVAHGLADDLLLAFICDDKVTEAYNRIERWYA